MHQHNIFNDDTRNWISSSSSITTWAAAPEVVNFGDDYYSCKSDIWLIGITALQFPCGGLPVSRRQDLDIMTKMLMKQPKSTSLQVAPNEDTTHGTRTLSKNFWNMVKICLAPDPAKRPAAEAQVLQEMWHFRWLLQYRIPVIRKQVRFWEGLVHDRVALIRAFILQRRLCF